MQYLLAHACIAAFTQLLAPVNLVYVRADAAFNDIPAQRSLLDVPGFREPATGRLDLADVADSEKRPFLLATFYRFRPEDSQVVMDFIEDEMMPTVASLLSRWFRVRNPSGDLNFGTETDSTGELIPPGPDGNGAYDADLVVMVTTDAQDSEECGGAVAQAESFLFDPLTRRPIFAELTICEPMIAVFDFNNMLQFVLQNVLKILGIRSNLFQMFVSAASLEDVMRIVPEADRAPTSSGAAPSGPEYSLITPNIVREARRHFGCPEMDSVLLNDVTFGIEPSELLSRRHYNGDLMRSGQSFSTVHYDRQAMTDITLGLMQDTGWYDVKYGSGGFNSYGYQAGCTFVMGTFEEALADPAGSRFLCPPEDVGAIRCVHDFSGQGTCRSQVRFDFESYEDLYTVDTDYMGSTFDCQNTPGHRCINTIDDDGDQQLLCPADFSCSSTGQVLFGELICAMTLDPDECPPDDLMCGSPGLLTCVGPELNDCNGQGDCFEGRCFCHLGFGGDDCTVPICTSGCADGSPCPASGFCGVAECGEWSVGDTGTGVPCTRN